MTYLATARPGRRRPHVSTVSPRPPWTNLRTSSLTALVTLVLGACSTSSESSDPYDASSAGTLGAETHAETQGSGTAPGDGDPGDDGPTLDIAESGDESDCDVWTQDCPDDQKCTWEVIDTIWHQICVPIVDDPRAPGEACSMFGDPGSGRDDCDLGAICSWLDDANEGVCLALCSGSPTEPSCEGAGLPALCQPCNDCPSLCVPTCDPLLDNCGLGYACIANAGNFTCTPAANVGDRELGDPCEYSLQCQAGFACIDGTLIPGCDGAGCCSPFCNLDNPACPQGLSCEPWFEGLEPGPLPHLGVCELV